MFKIFSHVLQKSFFDVKINYNFLRCIFIMFLSVLSLLVVVTLFPLTICRQEGMFVRGG